MKKIRGILLTLCVALGLLALMPVTASAVERSVGDTVELASALSLSAASGDSIRLTADIDHDDSRLWINGKAITFVLDGFTLNANAGLRVNNGGQLLLADPENGELNVYDTYNISPTQPLCDTYDSGSKAEVSNVSATGITTHQAVGANNGSEITVYGNVTHTGTAPNTHGVAVWNGSKVTVNGTITADKYIWINISTKTPAQYTTPTTKAGYFTYTDGTSTVWVKDNTPPIVSEGTPWWVWLLISLGGAGVLAPIPFTLLPGLAKLITGLVLLFIR